MIAWPKTKRDCQLTHDLVAAVDVDHLTSDGCAAVTGEEHASLAEFLSGNVAFERRVGRVVLHQVGESGDAASSQGVHPTTNCEERGVSGSKGR